MPSPSPQLGPKQKKLLRNIGRQVRARRKSLKVSAVATAEAAGVSRMTLNRIEAGEASVTMGAYQNVFSVLGLSLELADVNLNKRTIRQSGFELPEMIRIADFPQLKKLAWQIKGTKEISRQEALDIYERNWRHVDLKKLNSDERELIQGLLASAGRGRLLV